MEEGERQTDRQSGIERQRERGKSVRESGSL